MKNKFKNMKLVIYIIIILIALLLSFIMVKTNVIQKVIENLNKEEETITDGIYCKVYDNTSDKLKSLIIISRVDGIEKIEYLSDNGNGDTISLNCNNKQQVGIDYEVEIGREYNFKVTSNGEESIENIQLDENYINDYIKIIKLEDKDELSYNEVTLNFDLLRTAQTKQYKINQGPWTNYTNTIQLDLGDIDITKLLNSEYDTTIYVRTVDAAGYTLQNSKTIEITKHEDFDVFQSMTVSAKGLTNYGFSGSWNYNQNTNVGDIRNFAIRNLGIYFRQGGMFNYSASFRFSNISNTKPIKANQLYFMSYQNGADDYGTTNCSATIYYQDGTYTTSSTNYLKSRPGRNISNTTNLQDKEINYINFSVWGHRNSGGIQANIREIVLKGIELLSVE